MVRTVFLLGVLGLAGYGVVQWAVGGRVPGMPSEKSKPDTAQPGEDSARTTDATEPRKIPERVETRIQRVEGLGARFRDPILIPEARVNLVDFPELAALRTGKILFLGKRVPAQEIKGEAEMKKSARLIKRSFLAIETTPQEAATLKAQGYQIAGDARLWREWRGRDKDPIEPGKLNVVEVAEWFYPLKEGMKVEEGELLGLIDPQLSESELFIKLAKILASQAEVRASVKTKDEAKVRYDRNLRLLPTGAVSKEEVDGAKLTWERYIEEEEGKRASVEVARREIAQTEGVMRQHEIKAPVTGRIRRLNKQPEESVKEQDPILRVDSVARLQLEGYIGVQHRQQLVEGMPVIVEPIRRSGPVEQLRGHREAVTAVAVGQAIGPDKKEMKLILSAGEDRTVCVWEMRRDGDGWDGVELYRLDHPSVVNSISCTPPKSAKNLCLTGASDGLATLWDLDTIDKLEKVAPLKPTHRGAIFATAFSLDGKWAATAGEDKAIFLWDTATGERKSYINDAHKGAITSLAFTPDGLISAGRDKHLVLWPLESGKFGTGRELEQRSGQVEQLGVVALPRKDGKPGKQVGVLFDQGDSLRILDPSTWATRGIIKNPAGGTAFSNFALFAQDGRTVLTAGGGENRLQLWSNPVTHPKGRSTELRQYIWESPATCAAFDPDGHFVVTGTRDRHVLVWGLPAAKELEEPAGEGVLRHVGQALDSNARQVRVLVDVPRANEFLLSGDKATLVIYPK